MGVRPTLLTRVDGFDAEFPVGRPLRIAYPGAFYHITSRGNDRRSIFQKKKDYERFLGYFVSTTERH